MIDSYSTDQLAKHVVARRGSIYVAVMGVAMIVSIIGMVSMSIARLQLKSTRNLQDLEEARLLSQSGVEFGLGNMDFVSNWRTDCTNNVEKSPAIVVGNGTMTYKLVDIDGDLADDTTDAVQIIGIGRVGDAVHATSVLLEPTGVGLTCLEASFCTESRIDFSNGITWTTDQFISTNRSGADIIDRTGSGIINGDAEAVGTIWDAAVAGTVTEGITPRQMPDSVSVFDYYVANGTQISFSSIPLQAIDKQLISPASNPYGSSTNPLGIYVIDCEGADITIKDSRILGTLILLNAGSASNIDMDIHWEPVLVNYPALMVQGDFEMKWHAEHNLRESQHSVNFNPTGTPYHGSEDSDIVDEYPGVIKGLVYVSGLLTVSHQSAFHGVVVTGSVVLSADASFTYDSTFLNNPPPGFSAGMDMQIVPGTWRRIAY